ncbi:1,4-alpha-glucan branching protein [Streptomyces sp. NPDC050997]|uniref:maltokinase N-terminal cap-like domain-containing protein n=1 Tax=Streptomyces sp. NPDC050997 TaxID=3155519 RepID=UPI003418E02C
MSVIHRTTLKPTKLELLTAWLPTRPWYAGGPGEPELSKAGGFRLDDPQGEVGIEFLVATDTSGAHPTAYLVPLTYRGAPLQGAEHALVGTMEHGVLGPRWAYDGCHDPVLVAQLLALVEGGAQAQAQSVSDTPDLDVTRSYAQDGPLPSTALNAVDDEAGTELSLPQGATLRLHRVPRPASDGEFSLPPGAIGHVAGSWRTPDDAKVQSLFAVLYPGASA